MPFDQSTIVDVAPPVWDGSTLQLSWTSTAPPGTTFQVYMARRLAWSGTARWVSLTMPDSRVRVDVGAVGAGEGDVDFSAALPGATADRVTLSWLGGTYLDPTGRDDVQGFRVFGPPAPGAAVDYTAPLTEIPAYPGGHPIDGFGVGGFGRGGFGRSASSYSWTSQTLSGGGWTFAVASFDAAGNLGEPTTATTTIAAPPRPPTADPGGARLRISYDPATRQATLSWNPSPSA